MSKKIVIDKEQIDFVTLKKLRRYFGDNDKTLFEQRMYSFIGKLIETFDSATEIDTDQSIEFESLLSSELDKLPYTKHLDDGGYNDGQVAGFELGARWMKKFATEQDLISKARENDSVVTKDNISTYLKVIDSDGDIGEITKYDNELHNVFVKFFDGGSGLYCLNDKCEQDGHVETQLKLYDIKKLFNQFTKK